MTAPEKASGEGEARGAQREVIATFLLSLAMLGTQIAWTRIFSFMIWYHFAFLVISMAMLGFTVGGLLLNVRPAWFARPPGDLLFTSALGFCLSTFGALLGVCNLPFALGTVLDGARNLALFIALMLLVAFGFMWAGLFIAFAIARRPARIARVYAANMIGSGVGCALSVALLDRLLPASAVLAFALCAWGALLALLPLTSRLRRSVLLTALSCAVLLLAFVRSLDPLAEPFYMKSTKPFPAVPKELILKRASNSLATVDIFEPAHITGLWGLSDQRYFADHPEGGIPARVGFCIDGFAMTLAYHSPREITEEPVFDYLPSAIGYDIAQPASALVIGSGGGIDVICALRKGVREVTAVEINAIIMGAGREHADFNGGIFERPGVTPIVADGRSFVTSSGARTWDLIQLSGVDTLAASQAGAFTLAESYLYTIEAFTSYLEHLTPGGVLTLTRWMSDPPRQTLRVITLADAALRELGVKDTGSHMMLITDSRQRFSVFLISRSPFTEEQARKLLQISSRRDFVPLVVPHLGAGLPKSLYTELVALDDKSAFIRDYPFDISVTTDDRPFFFEHTKWENAWKYPDLILDRFNGHLILLVTTAIVALLGVLFILIPARYGLRGARRPQQQKLQRHVLLYFGCLGLGYVLVEMVLVQKLTLYLGNPVYALAVVLCGMLIFSGLGSLLSARLQRFGPRAVVGAAAAVAVALIGYRVALDAGLHVALGLPIAARIALALSLLAPPALLMGLPFPAAVAALGDERRDLVARGFVLNGYGSVLGACLAMIVSISFGFGAVLLAGAALYACAAAAFAAAARADRPG